MNLFNSLFKKNNYKIANILLPHLKNKNLLIYLNYSFFWFLNI